MISGVLVVIAIYLLVNLAILYIMPIETLATSKLAAADAIRLIFGEKSGKIVTFFLMVSILGMLNAQIMFAPRVIYSMSKDGLFFKLAQKVNSGGTPAFAMPLTGICSILLIISGKDTCERLSDIVSPGPQSSLARAHVFTSWPQAALAEPDDQIVSDCNSRERIARPVPATRSQPQSPRKSRAKARGVRASEFVNKRFQ
jgi:amino acid transporter